MPETARSSGGRGVVVLAVAVYSNDESDKLKERMASAAAECYSNCSTDKASRRMLQEREKLNRCGHSFKFLLLVVFNR